jgi:hypothetical protein
MRGWFSCLGDITGSDQEMLGLISAWGLKNTHGQPESRLPRLFFPPTRKTTAMICAYITHVIDRPRYICLQIEGHWK